MGDENLICTLRDYSKPSHEGYRNTIELPVGNSVVPLRSDIIRLVQNGCSFYGFGLRIQTNTSRISLNFWTHLTLMVKIGKEHAYVYFNFPFTIKLAIGLNAFKQDPSPHGRILLLDSLLNYFHQEGPQNSQRYPDVPTTSWRISIRSMDSFQGLSPKVPHYGIDLWLQVQIFYDHVNPVTGRTIDQSAGDKLRDLNAEESWALL
ncbi:hypothetical protein Tco_0222102 [Tanacetum coccineum]